MENDYISITELEKWLMYNTASLDTDADKEYFVERIREDILAADVKNEANNHAFDVGYWAGRRDYEPRWIPVEERLPDYSGRFLVVAEVAEGFAKGHKSIEICRRWSDDEWEISDVSTKFIITHWMPLPEPPKVEGGADG